MRLLYDAVASRSTKVQVVYDLETYVEINKK